MPNLFQSRFRMSQLVKIQFLMDFRHQDLAVLVGYRLMMETLSQHRDIDISLHFISAVFCRPDTGIIIVTHSHLLH
jgi:hypothetical protein